MAHENGSGERDDPDRLYAFWAKLLRPDGRVENTISLMVQTEVEAIDKAHALALLYRVELWESGRLIAAMPKRLR